MDPIFDKWLVNIRDLNPIERKLLPYIGQPRLKPSFGIFLNVDNLNTRSLYLHQMEVYGKMLEVISFTKKKARQPTHTSGGIRGRWCTLTTLIMD